MTDLCDGKKIEICVNASDLFALMHVQDQKNSGVHGGEFVAGDWRTRDLNTILTNDIAGASLGSNQITLPAGKYYIEGRSTAYRSDLNKNKIFNVTDNQDILLGFSMETDNVSSAVMSIAYVSGRFDLAEEKTIALQHRCSTTKLLGFGYACDFGGPEIYSDLKIWKVA